MEESEVVIEIRSSNINKLFASTGKIMLSKIFYNRKNEAAKQIKRNFSIKIKEYDLMLADYLQHFVDLFNLEEMVPIKVNVHIGKKLTCKCVCIRIANLKKKFGNVNYEDIKLCLNEDKYELIACINIINK